MSDPGHGLFSVIIPTLQRSGDLEEVVVRCAGHPRVLEVIVINNAPEPLSWASPKVRVMQQEQNIYVNPAWNLGAKEARGEFLAIVNDDVHFNDQAFDVAARGLRWFGVIGPDRSCFTLERPDRPGVRPARKSGTIFGYGTFMCLRRRNFVEIPDAMKIWGGDDWLIAQQHLPPGALVGIPFQTEMGTTSGSPEAQARRAQEQVIADRILIPLEGTRWWHAPVRWLDALRDARYRWSGRARTHGATLDVQGEA